MGLTGALFERKQITVHDQNRMYQLMEMYYENIQREVFINDLMEKEWVLLLKDSDTVIQGFTTIKIFDVIVHELPVRLVFSGDTILHAEYWGDLELPKSWIRAVYAMVKGYHGKAYWVLISKGYKTYRFLPVYFHRFYPCFNMNTPQFEKAIMDTFGKMKYPGGYDSERGIVASKGMKDYLKKGVADLSDARLQDPHINFFAWANPNYEYGDELVCLAELTTENMKPIVLRYLGARAGE